jgi:DNA-binding transcriptional ArsR family regulator
MIHLAPQLPTLLKALGDPTRLRALALLELEELSVGDLARALGMAQSRVSNHLRVLRDAGLLIERHVGTSIHLRPALGPDSEGSPVHVWPVQVWEGLRQGLETLPEHQADRARLADLVAARRAESQEFFDRVAGDWDEIGAHFDTGQARQRAAAGLLPRGLVLGDLGCGTGYFGRSLLGLATRLVGVDRSPGMLEEARGRLATAPAGTELDLRQGELDALPIADDELDGAVAGMVLHHLEHPGDALREIHRVVRPGGTAVVVELSPHREEWMRADLGDRHLGLAPGDVLAAFRRAGFEDVQLEQLDDRYRPAPRAGGEAADLALFTVRGHVASGHR